MTVGDNGTLLIGDLESQHARPDVTTCRAWHGDQYCVAWDVAEGVGLVQLVDDGLGLLLRVTVFAPLALGLMETVDITR